MSALGAREFVPDYIPIAVTHMGRHRKREEEKAHARAAVTAVKRSQARIHPRGGTSRPAALSV